MKCENIACLLLIGVFLVLNDARPQHHERCVFTGNVKGWSSYFTVCRQDVVQPKSRDDVTNGTIFYLYTRANWNSSHQVLPNDDSTLGPFDANKPTKYVVHGFSGSVATLQWMSDIKDALLRREDVNVVLVDWSSLASAPWYNIAANNSEFVGDYLAILVDYFVTKGSRLSDQHLIGHSLGGQVVGFAGAAVKTGKVGRISGLDPAHPLFENVGPEGRLDPTDAEFVDIIHTNSGELVNGELSFMEPIGHVDFYPNGGQRQPGCQDLFDSIESIKKHCSHQRNPELYIESVNNPSAFAGYHCSSYDNYTHGNCLTCQSNCPHLGYNAKPGDSGTYYLATRSTEPYDGKQLFVTLTLSSSQQSTAGHIYVTLVCVNGSDTAEITNENIPLDSGKTINSAIAIFDYLKDFTGGEIKYEQNPKFNSTIPVSIEKLIVYDPETNQSICSEATTVETGSTESLSWINC